MPTKDAIEAGVAQRRKAPEDRPCAVPSPRELSNGQKQRTALARALAGSPPLLLLDDPLRNVDAKLRFEMRLELPRLLRQTGATVVYVTQDYKEAMALGDRIAVMSEGRFGQIGTPEDIYLQPGDDRDRPAVRRPDDQSRSTPKSRAGWRSVDARRDVRCRCRAMRVAVGQGRAFGLRPEAIAVHPTRQRARCRYGRCAVRRSTRSVCCCFRPTAAAKFWFRCPRPPPQVPAGRMPGIGQLRTRAAGICSPRPVDTQWRAASHESSSSSSRVDKFYGPINHGFMPSNISTSTVKRGEIVALLGSSGCGKTSTLRMVAGFEDVSRGTISLDRPADPVLPPVKRNVAMAFEGYSLYPPLTVRENIAFALKAAKLPAEVGEQAVVKTSPSCWRSRTSWTAIRARSPAASSNARVSAGR